MNREVLNEFMGWVWNIMLLVGITYYVFERDQSGWWYLLFLAFHASRSNNRKDDEEKVG